MRYYDIQIFKPPPTLTTAQMEAILAQEAAAAAAAGGQGSGPATSPSGGLYVSAQASPTTTKPASPFRQFTSHPNGQPDPGALNVVIDAFVYTYDAGEQQAHISIWGVAPDDLAQAANFTGCTIKIYGGFQKGMPLNNPAQAGLLLTGNIYQSFGNWIGTERTLDFVVTVLGAVASDRANVSFSWRAGTPLSQALTTTLSNAFPGVTPTIQIHPNLVTLADKSGSYSSLTAFSQMLKPFTQSIIGGNYLGVSIAMTSVGILVQDGSVKPTPVQIAFQDLIGQPTWIDNLTIQIMFPMRSDISVGGRITMPQGLFGNASNPAGPPGAVTTTEASQPQARQRSQFTGTFKVNRVHHMGRFRQADGMAWVTVVDALSESVPVGNVTFQILSITQ